MGTDKMGAAIAVLGETKTHRVPELRPNQIIKWSGIRQLDHMHDREITNFNKSGW